jgi:hypothetical protein
MGVRVRFEAVAGNPFRDFLPRNAPLDNERRGYDMVAIDLEEAAQRRTCVVSRARAVKGAPT